jgi:purine-nucleoside phosphorylase
MSTGHEAIVARSLGMEILGLSLVTNLAAGLSPHPLSHGEVLAAGKASAARMADLMTRIIPQM